MSEADRLERLGAAHIAKEGPGGALAGSLPPGCHERVQYCAAALQSRRGSLWKPSGMRRHRDPVAPAASPTQQAWAEAEMSVLAILRQGCFRGREACLDYSGIREAEAESRVVELEVHAVPSTRLGFHEAGMTRLRQVR